MDTSSGTVINVCFHGIGEPGRELEPGEDAYWVDTDSFRAILDEVATWPAVRLSFDDGNASDLAYALPALAERSLVADFFVLAGRLRTPGSLDGAGVRQLRAAGMRIGTHGMAHRSWRGLDQVTQRDEFVVARERLADTIGEPVDTAACPLGQYDRRVLGTLRRLGYTRVFTSDRRRARPGAWLQPRYSVRRDDTPGSLRASVLARPDLRRQARATAAGIVKRLR
jgi:peptidoglycan/xylan/chitin deacetylase (PgdA/CDA1 family)